MSYYAAKKIIFLYISLIIIFLFSSCDGIFPSQSKVNVPDDHTSNRGGALHKGGERESDDCHECHGSDLRGQVYNYNGTLVVTSSCYQCHGNVWEEGGGGDKLFKK